MIREYVNNLVVPNNNWHVLKPHFYLRIDSSDNANIQTFQMSSWTPGDYTESPFGAWIGLRSNDASTSITFTGSVTMPKTGKYYIEMYLWKRTRATGDMTVTIDGTNVLTENVHNDWDDYGRWIKSNSFTSTSGAKTFVVTVPKYAYVHSIRIIPITRYEGGNEVSLNSENRLDIIDIEFTSNGINEVDDITIKCAMKEDYYDDSNPYSMMCFDAWDSLTLAIGDSASSVIPMFGGYVSGYELSDDGKILTIHGVDRIMDLSRTIVWKNFSIGYIPETASGRYPFTQFPNVNEIARYLCATDYGINFDSITRDYIVYNNFANSTDVTTLPNSGWNLDWQPDFGNPAPCMRMRPGAITTSSLTIYSDTMGIWDAADYNMFNFDYYVSGAGVLFPTRFNVEIDMFKAGQTASNASTYTIPFTGDAVTTRVLTTPQPKFDGNWNHFTVDLKDYFNKTAASSTEYHITAIRLVGKPDFNQVLNNKCSSIYIDHIMGYKDFQQAPRYASSDSKSPMHELQDLCEKCNQIGYVRPAMERRDDKFIMIPKRFYTLPLTIKEGENLLNVSGLTYKPIDWEMATTAHRTFNYDENRSGTIQKQDDNAIKWYNWILHHEFLSDVSTDADANAAAQQYVDEHAFNYPGFSVTVKGSTIFEPGQYMQVKIPSRRINGSYEVKSLSFKLDAVNNKFTTDISFNQPHGYFMNFMRQTKKNQKRLENLESNYGFRTMGLDQGSRNTSSGAYVK